MDHTHQFAVERMCRVLQVSKSGYYKWLKQRASKNMKSKQLRDKIKYEFERSRCTYGSPRIAQELNAETYTCSKSTVARHMSLMNIAARNKKKFKTTTCLLYTSPSPRDLSTSRMPSSA